MFELTKWYFDAVDAEGRSAIAYWTELRWGPVAVRWEDLSLHPANGLPTHRSGMGRADGPVRLFPPAGAGTPGKIRWDSQALATAICCEPWGDPYHARLLDSDEGCLDWWCEAPAATVTIDPPGIQGVGYAERLTLTVPPWRLPISELRWGRWSCAETRQSIVWIEWRGGKPVTLVLVNGTPAACASVEDRRVLFDGGELRLEDSRTLHARTLGDVVAGLGPLALPLPAPWRAVEDRKSISRGRWADAGGWAIHETVRFP